MNLLLRSLKSCPVSFRAPRMRRLREPKSSAKPSSIEPLSIGVGTGARLGVVSTLAGPREGDGCRLDQFLDDALVVHVLRRHQRFPEALAAGNEVVQPSNRARVFRVVARLLRFLQFFSRDSSPPPRLPRVLS